jgi:predicted HAD superfamily Cof-like phosphohydrolase
MNPAGHTGAGRTEIDDTGAEQTEVATTGEASRAARQVAEFHRAYGLPVCSSPQPNVDAGLVALRQSLIDEEVGELRAAAAAGDLVGVADALADIVYVAYGTAHTYGIDLDAVLDEVHASNMTKLGSDGAPVRRADGKVLKGPDYRPPDITTALGLSGR